jgi:hypothetical protein
MRVQATHIFSVVLASSVALCCSAPPQTSTATKQRYIATPVASLSPESLPLSGRYYTQTVESGEYTSHPEALVAEIERRAIPAIRVWFRPARNECNSAGGLRSVERPYPAVYVVQIIARHDGLRELGFKEVAGRPMILCPYEGIVYVKQE